MQGTTRLHNIDNALDNDIDNALHASVNCNILFPHFI